MQYAKYVNTLGAETVPKTFDKFQKLKYTDSEKWAELKGAYRYVGRNPGADMKSYQCAMELKNMGVKGSVHIPKKEIDVSALGFDNAHINAQRQHNVTEREAKGFLENAAVSITKRNGLTENYFSKTGAAYVNPIENAIKTAFNSNEFKGEASVIMEVLERYGY